MRLINSCKISENLEYHIRCSIPLTESVFRQGSDSHYNLIEEVRSLYQNGFIELSNLDDRFIVEKLDTGKKAKYKDGKELIDVRLDDPEIIRDKNKKFGVYVDSGEKNEDGSIKAILVKFGDNNSEIANDDDGRRKSFLARHKCDQKKDKKDPGFWSCNIHLFWKKLKLKSSKPW